MSRARVPAGPGALQQLIAPPNYEDSSSNKCASEPDLPLKRHSANWCISVAAGMDSLVEELLAAILQAQHPHSAAQQVQPVSHCRCGGLPAGLLLPGSSCHGILSLQSCRTPGTCCVAVGPGLLLFLFLLLAQQRLRSCLKGCIAYPHLAEAVGEVALRKQEEQL